MMKGHFEGLGKIAEWAHRSGDNIVGGINEESNGERVRGFHIRRGGSLIYLESSVSNTFATVTAVWRITNLLSGEIPEAQVENRITQMQSDQNTSRKDIRESIAHDYIEQHQDWVSDKVEEVLESKFEFESRVSFTTIPGENEIADGFRVTQKIYPQDDTFTYRHYDQTVQEVNREQAQIGEMLSDGIDDEFSLLTDEAEQQIETQAESQERDSHRGTAYQ